MQRAEIAAIMNQLPAWKQKRVRFVFSGAEGGPKTSFLIVDDEGPIRPGEGVRTYRVLNASCNTFYDPVNDYAFVGTSCGADANVSE